MSPLSGAGRAAAVAILSVLAFASSAHATTTIQFATDSGSRGAGGTTAQLVITGNGENNQVTLQRVENDDLGNPGLTNTDMIKITDPTGAARVGGAPGSDSADFCKDIPAENSAVCYIHDAASAVRTDGSTLGAGNDTLTVVPAATGGEIGVEMNGGSGDDRLVGASAADTFMGGDGSDTMLGNGGADFFSDVGATPGEIDTVDYNDSAHTSAGVNVTFDDGNSNDGTDGVDGTFAGDQVGIGIDKVIGTDFDDLLFGSAASEILVGGLGKDSLFGQDGNDRVEARDSAADSSVECGDGSDIAITDSNDPAAVGCETEDRTAAPGGGGGSAGGGGGGSTTPISTPAPGLATFATQSQRAMPDLREPPFAGLSTDEMETELRRTLWVVLDPQPLAYAQAASRAGKANVRPYDIIAQSPNAGATVSGTAAAPARVKVFFWDPAKDAVKQPCNNAAILRSGSGRGDRVRLVSALRGMEFREGTPGDEGEAQDLLRRVGCQYDARITYSAKARSATVRGAKATTLERRRRINGKVKTIRVKGFELRVTAPRNGNDFLTTFTEPLSLRANELPLNTSLQLPAGRTVRAQINVRETATGRIAEGTTVELSAPGGEVIASGRTGTDGMVSLTGFIAGTGTYELYLSRQRTDPVTRELVRQEGILQLTAVQPGQTWPGVAGTVFKRKGDLFTRGAAGLALRQGAPSPISFILTLTREIATASAAGQLADKIAAKAVLTKPERDALATKLVGLLGVPLDSPARAMAGLRPLKLLPGIGATAAGKLCPTYRAPVVRTVSAFAADGASLVAGKAEGAAFGCGAAVMIDPDTGLVLVGSNNVLGGRLIANDGTTLMSNHGGGIVSNHSTGLIANDGAGLIANDGASLIANDGASLVPTTSLLANDGASLIANDGASLQPIGVGTTFQPAGR